MRFLIGSDVLNKFSSTYLDKLKKQISDNVLRLSHLPYCFFGFFTNDFYTLILNQSNFNHLSPLLYEQHISKISSNLKS